MSLLSVLLARLDPDADARRVARVLAGDARETDALVDQLMGPIQRRVAWVLSKGKRSAGRNDVLDYTQDVLVKLFEDDHRILRSWSPDKGASLEAFVQLVAQRLVLSSLRSGRKSGWAEDPTLNEDLERQVSATDVEQQTWSKDTLHTILDRMEEELTPRSWALFRALFVEEQEPAEVAKKHDMSLNALYSWRSRFRTQARAWAEKGEGKDS
ncbi:MAG: sigma-70 family RNA polymerase sigma factor [Deltaproteobacteria bacterium]